MCLFLQLSVTYVFGPCMATRMCNDGSLPYNAFA